MVSFIWVEQGRLRKEGKQANFKQDKVGAFHQQWMTVDYKSPQRIFWMTPTLDAECNIQASTC